MATPTAPGATTTELKLRNCVVDLRRGTVDLASATTKLTTREVEFLAYLAARPRQVVSREELLVEVWGYGPDVVSRTVDTTARRLRQKIELDPSEPDHLLTVQGVGYRFEPAIAERVPRPPSPDDSRTNITIGDSSFVGRARDLEALDLAFSGGARLVTLMGPGGTGKTRLARAFAARVADDLRFAGGWFCDLVATRTGGAVEAAMATMLGVGPTDDAAERGARIEHALRGWGPALVVLDNFEQVASAAPTTVGRWLEVAPEVRFLVTSRERLQVAGEQVLDLAPLSEVAAVQLFEDRARAARASFALDDRSRPVVAEICQRLDRLPLAIELAAARITVLSVVALRTQLEKRFRLLVARRRDVTERQRTMRGAIAWSWDLLSSAERTTLASCSVFAGSFGADAADAVVDLDGEPDDPWTVDVLDALQDKSLVRALPDAGGATRLRLLESIRLFAAEQLDDLGVAEAVTERHRAHFLGVAAHAAPDELASERDNLLEAHARVAGSDDEAGRRARIELVLALDPVLSIHGPYDIHLGLLDDAVAAATGLDGLVPARAHLARADRRRLKGDTAGAGEDLATVWEALGVPAGDRKLDISVKFTIAGEEGAELAAEAATTAGQLAAQEGRTADADAAFAMATDLASRAGLAPLLIRVRYARALLCRNTGRRDEAEGLYREVLVAAAEVGDGWHEGLAHGGLGVLAIGKARAAEAEDHLAAGLAIQRRRGDRRAEAVALGNLGLLHSHQGRTEAATTSYEEASAAARQVGDQRLEALLLRNLAILRMSVGRLGESEADFVRALGIHRRMADRWQQGRCLVELAEVMVQRERLDRAEELYREGLEIAQSLDDREGAGLGQGNLGVLAHLRGDLDASLALNEQALEALSRPQDLWLGCYYMAYGCALRAERGDFAGAAALLKRAGGHVTSLKDLAGIALVDACEGALEAALAEPSERDGIIAAAEQKVSASGQDEESHAVRVGLALLRRLSREHPG